MSMGLGEMLTGILVFALLFLVLREFFCWYWKINRVVALLENIEANLSAGTK